MRAHEEVLHVTRHDYRQSFWRGWLTGFISGAMIAVMIFFGTKIAIWSLLYFVE